MADGYPTAGPGLPPSPEELRVGPRPLTGEISGPPLMPSAPSTPMGPPAAEGLTTEQILAGELPPELAPPPAGEEDPLAGVGMHRAFAGRPVMVTGGDIVLTEPSGAMTRLRPGDPGYQEAAEQRAAQQFGEAGPAQPVRTGATTVQTALQSDTSAQAQAMMGPRGAALVEQLRGQGVPEETIRQRLGLRTGPAPGAGMGRMGMGRPAAPKLPPELRALNPEPGFYLPGYREALEASDIPDEQKGQLRQQYETWLETDPRGVAARKQEMELGFGEKMAGFEQQRQAAEQRELDAQRELAAQQAEKAKLQEAEFAQFRADYEQSYQQADAEYRRAVDEMKATKVDPRRGQVPILDALALALGAAGAAFTGQPNFAQKLISDRIDRDIKAQLADISTLKDVAAAKRNRLGMLRQQLGDEQAAIQTERQLQLDQAKAYLAEQAATGKSEMARVDAQRYAAEVDRQLSRAQIDNEQRIRVQAGMAAGQRLQMMRAAAGAQAQARRKQQGQRQLAAQGLAGYRPLGKDEAKRVIPGVGIALPGSKVQDLRDEAAKFRGAMRNVETMDRILQKYQGSDFVMSEDDKAAYRRAAAQVDVPTINAVAGASMTEGEMQRIAPMLAPEATDAIGRQRYDMGRVMTGYKNQLQGSFRERMGAHVERPVSVGVNPETGRQEYMVPEGVSGPAAWRTGAGGATVMPGTAPGQ